MSPRGLPERAHFCGIPPREGEGSAGAIRRIHLVGKQSTKSNPIRSVSISILAKWPPSLGDFHPLGSLPSSSPQDPDSRRSLCADQIRSTLLRLLRRHCNTAVVRSTSIPFGCNDFSSSVCDTPLTRDSSSRNILPPRAGSKRTALSKSPNDPVAGLSPESVES